MAYVAVLAALMVGAPGAAQAQACGCLCEGERAFHAPSYETVIIPTNPRLFVRLDPRTRGRMSWVETSTGAEVAFVAENASDVTERVSIVRPLEPLQPETDYLLSLEHVATDTTAAFTETLTLRTGPSEDHEAPSAPALRLVTPRRDTDLCHTVVGARVEHTPEVTLDWSEHPVHEIELRRDGTFLGRVFVRRDEGHVLGTEQLGEGAVPCLQVAQIGGLVEGETLAVRTRVWDAAGNASPFVESEVVVGVEGARAPGSPCPYCSISAPGAARGGASWLVLALGALVLARRRQRAREATSAR